MTQKKEDIIKAIQQQKENPNLKYRLKDRTEEFTKLLFRTLFDSETLVSENLDTLETLFEELVDMACWEPEKPCKKLWESYLNMLPEILEKLNKDAKAFVDSDPAANSIEEVYLSYPGFYAIVIYRLSHELYKFGMPLVPRLMSECAHRISGADINPGAQIGESFFLDHATGTVIGETTIIKNNVKIYQGVTLGALSVAKNLRNVKRHPTVEDNVVIYANATILGGETTIGADSVVGGNTWITNSVPANSIASNTNEVKIKTTENV
ncbi:serine O-acetyltransferase EpsC [Marixanthomonas spongiae]|uniref:Serine acetyltransferase n=1 Tax=Marixanthomonas spongiae TaxID=2174845 RepID=A0A2U0I2J7_9FLAO|nr:serine O-acetyltransferase EpsC [Marixanthomonas spongiae]PVW15327.1 serine acetyltransferase [Marixanthomonas spongiae]